MSIETVDMAGIVSERPATKFDGGTQVQVALVKQSAWEDERPPVISVQRFVVSDALDDSTGVQSIDVRRSVKRRSQADGGKRREAARSYRGPTKLGWLEAHEATALAYALLAAVEELEENYYSSEVPVAI